MEHLCSEASDHAPIIMSNGKRESSQGRHLFCFLEAWTIDAASSEVVKLAWDQNVSSRMEAQKVQQKLAITANALKS